MRPVVINLYGPHKGRYYLEAITSTQTCYMTLQMLPSFPSSCTGTHCPSSDKTILKLAGNRQGLVQWAHGPAESYGGHVQSSSPTGWGWGSQLGRHRIAPANGSAQWAPADANCGISSHSVLSPPLLVLLVYSGRNKLWIQIPCSSNPRLTSS